MQDRATDEWPGGCTLGSQPQSPWLKGVRLALVKIKAKERLEDTADQLLNVQSWEEKHRERALLPSQTLGTHCPAAPTRRAEAGPGPS